MENEVRVKVVPRSKRVAFTGYRPQKMPFGFDEQDERCVDFKKRLHDTIESFIWQGYQHFISGGALGMDMYAAEAVLDLKKQYPEIMLEMVSPLAGASTGIAIYFLFERQYVAKAPVPKSCILLEHLVDNAICWQHDGQPGDGATTVPERDRVSSHRPCAKSNDLVGDSGYPDASSMSVNVWKAGLFLRSQ